jgi:L-lactate dehydrogenase (cytochrome)
MRSATFFSVIATVLAARPFLDVADTGLEDYLTGTANWTEGTLPSLQDMRAIPDFEFAAKQVLEDEGWSFYRLAAGQEWSESDTCLMILRAWEID